MPLPRGYKARKRYTSGINVSRFRSQDAATDASPILAPRLGLQPATGGFAKSAQTIVIDMNAVQDEFVGLAPPGC
jgi:hypothetical protein